MNIMDGFLTTHLERTFYKHESELIREYLGAPDDIIDCPTPAQRTLFGPTRRRVPKMMDLTNPILLGPVQNQEHYMQGVVARRNNFAEPILAFLEAAYAQFAELTGRSYGLLSKYKTEDAETVFVSLGSAAENIEAAVDYLRETRGASVGSIHVNVIRPFPEAAIVAALKGKRMSSFWSAPTKLFPATIRWAATFAPRFPKLFNLSKVCLRFRSPRFPDLRRLLRPRLARLPSRAHHRRVRVCRRRPRPQGRQDSCGRRFLFRPRRRPPLRGHRRRDPVFAAEGAVAVRFHSIGGWGAITTGKNLGAILATSTI